MFLCEKVQSRSIVIYTVMDIVKDSYFRAFTPKACPDFFNFLKILPVGGP